MIEANRIPFPETPIWQQLCALADDHGNHPAIIGPGIPAHTYAALLQMVEDRSRALWLQGLRPGTTLCLVNEDVFEFILGLLAAARIGARVIPLAPALDPALQEELLRLGDAQWIGGSYSMLAALDHTPLSRPEENSAMQHYLLLPTSGSTGQPKLVVRTQAAMLAEGRAYTRSLPITADDSMLATIPLHHAYGIGLCVFGMLAAGCTLIIIDHFAPRAALYAADEAGATLLAGVPYIFDLMARTPLKRPIKLARARMGLAGAAPLHHTTFERFQATFGLAIRSTCGSSETGALACVADNDFRPGRVGQSLWDVELEIRDDAEVLQSEASGKLFARTPALMLGYLTGSGLDTTALDRGWFHTGDLGRIDGEGDLYLTGRTAQLINVSGKKINPRMVEAVLCEHPSIADAAVIGVTDADAVTRLVAFVVQYEADLDPHQIVAYCSQRLSAHAVPRFIRPLPTLPRSATGKLLYADLETLWEAQRQASTTREDQQ
jgi:acyl-CoA synthetase (AMP-forming)/AMP-acid ligase II